MKAREDSQGQIIVPRGWRWLGTDELTQKGDRFAQVGPSWQSAGDYIGFSTLGEHRWIRRIGAESAPKPVYIRLTDLPKYLKTLS